MTLSTSVSATPIEINGPLGPLSAEMLAVDGADHAVVIIPGSGEIDRDGNLHQTYSLLAKGLAEQGIASLRIDKRGLFGSAKAIADPNNVTIADYAQDSRDWAVRAAQLAQCIWLAGHSEGGLVALVAAQKPPDGLCGLILLASPGRPVGQILREQLERNPANAPLMQEINAVITRLENGIETELESLSPVLHKLFNPDVQPYMVDLFSHDPAQISRHWKGPALIVQGDADIQIKVRDAEMLATAMDNAQSDILSGATHVLKIDVPEKPFATYTDPTLPLHPDLIPAIVDFLAAHQPE